MRVSGEDWVLANTNVSGYFRVNYDDDNWDRLLSVLDTNHQVSHVPFYTLWVLMEVTCPITPGVVFACLSGKLQTIMLTQKFSSCN